METILSMGGRFLALRRSFIAADRPFSRSFPETLFSSPPTVLRRKAFPAPPGFLTEGTVHPTVAGMRDTPQTRRVVARSTGPFSAELPGRSEPAFSPSKRAGL